MQVLLQAKHVAPFYSLQTRCLSHPIVLSRLSRPCELNDRFRLCRPRRYLLCAHQFAADSVRVDGGRLAHPKARARPVVKDSFQTVFGMFIRPHHEKSGIGKENYPRICDRLPPARILTHLTHSRILCMRCFSDLLRFAPISDWAPYDFRAPKNSDATRKLRTDRPPREKASSARRRRRGRARRAKVGRARLVLPHHRSLSRLVARRSLHVLPNAPARAFL